MSQVMDREVLESILLMSANETHGQLNEYILLLMQTNKTTKQNHFKIKQIK